MTLGNKAEEPDPVGLQFTSSKEKGENTTWINLFGIELFLVRNLLIKSAFNFIFCL